LWQQFKIALPSSLQQLFFAAGLVTLVWIVGQIGTAEVAAVNVLMTFHITAILPAFGIALATTTLVGNALGRKDTDDAEQWGWNGAVLTFIYGILLSLILIPFARPILGIFLTNPETLELAYLPMILWALMISFDTLGMVLMNALIGAGDTRRSMWISLIAQWAFFLPIAFVVGPLFGYGLLGVWVVNGFYRIGQALVTAQQWRSRKWAGIEV
jgi:Na+-driven multidrug efflux pump